MFLSKLEVELVEDASNDYRGSWRLTAPLEYWSSIATERFVVPAGFVTDFESCPRIPVAFDLFGEVCHAAAALHDWLYTHPTTVTREMADAILREACIESGVSRWRAYGIWLGVRMGGGGHYGKQ